ncbi:hypothetical protein E2C01_086064 [Portunus trituberculatus]|uniref:Uncharacterized protein n=1 Tax=Portunus trituberculatus TaxID=210409 RepID=A0A5B7IZS2_PORTR|nr:hypothetical protein [Portunus trituberculatus]
MTSIVQDEVESFDFVCTCIFHLQHVLHVNYCQTDGGEVVLGLQHLQATFYILILGLAAASSTFILEQVAGRRFSSSAERLGM